MQESIQNLQRKHVRNIISSIANSTTEQHEALSQSLARLVELMDKNDRKAEKKQVDSRYFTEENAHFLFGSEWMNKQNEIFQENIQEDQECLENL